MKKSKTDVGNNYIEYRQYFKHPAADMEGNLSATVYAKPKVLDENGIDFIIRGHLAKLLKTE